METRSFAIFNFYVAKKNKKSIIFFQSNSLLAWSGRFTWTFHEHYIYELIFNFTWNKMVKRYDMFFSLQYHNKHIYKQYNLVQLSLTPGRTVSVWDTPCVQELSLFRHQNQVRTEVCLTNSLNICKKFNRDFVWHEIFVFIQFHVKSCAVLFLGCDIFTWKYVKSFAVLLV